MSEEGTRMAGRVVVLGGGVEALWAAVEAALAGAQVTLVHHRAMTDGAPAGGGGGFNAPAPDEITAWWEATCAAAGPVAPDPQLRAAMAERAQSLLDVLARMGVPWDATDEGVVARRALGGKGMWTASAGPFTGFWVHRVLAQQLAAADVETMPRQAVLALGHGPSGSANGVVTADVLTRAVRWLPADAVVVAGCGLGDVHLPDAWGWDAALMAALGDAGATLTTGPDAMVLHGQGASGAPACVVPPELQLLGARLDNGVLDLGPPHSALAPLLQGTALGRWLEQPGPRRVAPGSAHSGGGVQGPAPAGVWLTAGMTVSGQSAAALQGNAMPLGILSAREAARAAAEHARAAQGAAASHRAQDEPGEPVDPVRPWQQRLEDLAAARGRIHPLELQSMLSAVLCRDPSTGIPASLEEAWRHVDGVDHRHAPHNPWPVRTLLLQRSHAVMRRVLGTRAEPAAPEPAVPEAGEPEAGEPVPADETEAP